MSTRSWDILTPMSEFYLVKVHLFSNPSLPTDLIYGTPFSVYLVLAEGLELWNRAKIKLTYAYTS